MDPDAGPLVGCGRVCDRGQGQGARQARAAGVDRRGELKQKAPLGREAGGAFDGPATSRLGYDSLFCFPNLAITPVNDASVRTA